MGPDTQHVCRRAQNNHETDQQQFSGHYHAASSETKSLSAVTIFSLKDCSLVEIAASDHWKHAACVAAQRCGTCGQQRNASTDLF